MPGYVDSTCLVQDFLSHGLVVFLFFLSIQIIFLADKIKRMHSAYTTIAFPLLSVSLQSICRLLSGSSVGCGSSTGYNCLWARKWQTFKGKIISNEEIFFLLFGATPVGGTLE